MMDIKLREIPVKWLYDGYKNDDENGVVGYGGKLNIRPAFQREFVYDNPTRDAVVRSVSNGFPINVMYWSVTGDGTFEMLDGQQRTISICEYVKGRFSVDEKSFHNLTQDKQKEILDYKLQVYFCSGTDSEKLAWFKTINVAGAVLTAQEMRNAIYVSPWLTDMKAFFSKSGCPASKIGKDYMTGTPIRQDYLETVLKWLCDSDGTETIEKYMDAHTKDANAREQWLYFESVINWIKATFPAYRKEMKGLPWGLFYNAYHTTPYDPDKLESEIKALFLDDDVSNHKGVYEYLLSGREEESALSIRKFSDNMKRRVYTRQGGKCAKCGGEFKIEEMDADHITPWSQGGHTTEENCQMLCKHCNRTKSDK